MNTSDTAVNPNAVIDINGQSCFTQSPRSERQFIRLADIEAQILHRERIMVKFLRGDDHSYRQVATPGPGGHLRFGYSWELALPDKATVMQLYKRICRDVPLWPFAIIGLTGQTILSSDLAADGVVAVKLVQLGKLRHRSAK
jgi:hypothetical protein